MAIEQQILRKIHESIGDSAQYEQAIDLYRTLINLKNQGFEDVPKLPGSEMFLPETQDLLLNQGFIIIQLDGSSLRDLRASGNPFFSNWFHEDNFLFDMEPSHRYQAAINPNFPYLRNLGTSQEQTLLLEEINETNQIPGTTWVQGSAADYAKIAFDYAKKSGTRLFGDYYVRSKTKSSEGQSATVGMFGAAGLNVGHELDTASYENLRLVPLLIPPSIDSQ